MKQFYKLFGKIILSVLLFFAGYGGTNAQGRFIETIRDMENVDFMQYSIAKFNF